MNLLLDLNPNPRSSDKMLIKGNYYSCFLKMGKTILDAISDLCRWKYLFSSSLVTLRDQRLSKTIAPDSLADCDDLLYEAHTWLPSSQLEIFFGI